MANLINTIRGLYKDLNEQNSKTDKEVKDLSKMDPEVLRTTGQGTSNAKGKTIVYTDRNASSLKEATSDCCDAPISDEPSDGHGRCSSCGEMSKLKKDDDDKEVKVDAKDEKKFTKEEAQLDEISQETKNNYIKKAKTQMRSADHLSAIYSKDAQDAKDEKSQKSSREKARKMGAIADKRSAGIEKATRNEEVQIDEISDEKKKHYVSRAALDVSNKSDEAGSERAKGNYEKSREINKKVAKRLGNIAKTAYSIGDKKKQQNEEVELDEAKVTFSDTAAPGKGAPIKDMSKKQHIDSVMYHEREMSIADKNKQPQNVRHHQMMAKVHRTNAEGGSSHMYKEEANVLDKIGAAIHKVVVGDKQEKPAVVTAPAKKPAPKSKMKPLMPTQHESVEIIEGNAAAELEKYGKSKGGIDKDDFMAISRMIKRRKSPKEIGQMIRLLDTDPRDKIISIITKADKRMASGLGIREEVELDEISQETLKSYKKKATSDAVSNMIGGQGSAKRLDKRIKGMRMADKKIAPFDADKKKEKEAKNSDGTATKPMSRAKQLANKGMKEENVYEASKFGLTQGLLDAVKGVLAADSKAEPLDPVDPKEAKKKFKDRKDKDIDNDGNVDNTDKYLAKKRQAVTKAVEKDKEAEGGKKAKSAEDVKKGKGTKGQEAIEVNPNVNEDHFKVGDEVKCKESGMTGKVVKVGDGKGAYYTVKRSDGKEVQYPPKDLIAEGTESGEKNLELDREKAAREKLTPSDRKKLDAVRAMMAKEKKKEMKEETEQLDELSKQTIKDYMDKARASMGGNPTERDPAKFDKRMKGLKNASKKMGRMNPFGLYDNNPKFDAANKELSAVVNKAKKMANKKQAMDMIGKVQQKYRDVGAMDTEVNQTIKSMMEEYTPSLNESVMMAVMGEAYLPKDFTTPPPDEDNKVGFKAPKGQKAGEKTYGTNPKTKMPAGVTTNPAHQIESADELEEKEMTDAQMKKREKIVKSMKDKMGDFKDRYGDRAKAVMYATANKLAMKAETVGWDDVETFTEEVLGEAGPNPDGGASNATVGYNKDGSMKIKSLRSKEKDGSTKTIGTQDFRSGKPKDSGSVKLPIKLDIKF